MAESPRNPANQLTDFLILAVLENSGVFVFGDSRRS
jgi:hypothetical protein